VQDAKLDTDSVASWTQFGALLSAPATAAAQRLAAALDAERPGWRSEIADSAGQGEVIAAVNRVLQGDALYGDDVAAALAADSGLRPYFAAQRDGAGRGDAGLTAPQRERMNRLIVDKALPGALRPAIATRWKNPAQLPGLHILGTDESGRDVLARIIHGARVSLSVGFVSVFLATVIGLVTGSLAAYYGGKVDMLISRFLEIMMCFPSFFLILAVIAVLDRRSIINIMLVIGLTSWTGVARLIRGEMLRQKKMDYVSASVALGASDTRTIFRHILPNAMAPVLVSISFGITGAILTEAGLSFIGFGVTPPTPTWGQLLSEGRDSPLSNWWQAVFPGIVLFVSVLAYNMVGEGLRDALDPRSD
jgi:peptide/nickel transport system permease protein